MTGFQTHFHLSFDCNHQWSRALCWVIILFYTSKRANLHIESYTFDSIRFNRIHFVRWQTMHTIHFTAFRSLHFDKQNRLEYRIYSFIYYAYCKCPEWLEFGWIVAIVEYIISYHIKDNCTVHLYANTHVHRTYTCHIQNATNRPTNSIPVQDDIDYFGWFKNCRIIYSYYYYSVEIAARVGGYVWNEKRWWNRTRSETLTTM